MIIPPAIDPPSRLLMGPGPVTADPRVLRAMASPLIGQFDPVMTGYMTQVTEMFRGVFVTDSSQTLLIDGTARAAIEAALVSLLEPGQRVLVPVFGRFGLLLVEIAERCGAEVHTVEVPWGQVVPAELVEQSVIKIRPHLLAMVQGDTSTTMCQPLADIGEICQRHDVMLYCDATASLVGNTFLTDAWHIDIATAGLQKCLSGPPGIAPITISDRAADVINHRRHVEAGIRIDSDRPQGVRIASNYLDLAMIMDYWGPRRLNHHTEATSMLYAAHECARIVLSESLDATIQRHALNGHAMLAGVQALGLGVFGDLDHKMNNVVAVEIPEGVDGEAVRAGLLTEHGIEIGTSFGPLHGRVWRIGTMGYNARPEAVLNTLNALEQVLRENGVPVTTGAGTAAAKEMYS